LPARPELLPDLERNRLKPVYDSRGRSYNVAEATMPRFDLLDIQRYNRLTVQTQRGCPYSLRLLRLSGCTLFDINYQPKQMSVDELNSGLVDLTQKIYSDDAVNKRVRRFFKRKKELAAQEKFYPSLESTEQEAFATSIQPLERLDGVTGCDNGVRPRAT